MGVTYLIKIVINPSSIYGLIVLKVLQGILSGVGWSYPELLYQAKYHTLIIIIIIIIIIIMKREKEREREREGGREKEGGRDRERERERKKRDRDRHKDKKRKKEREAHFLVQPKGAYLSFSCNSV